MYKQYYITYTINISTNTALLYRLVVHDSLPVLYHMHPVLNV